jgi:hypothetical protein
MEDLKKLKEVFKSYSEFSDKYERLVYDMIEGHVHEFELPIDEMIYEEESPIILDKPNI